MFDNIGKKIKMLAKIITWVFMAISVLAGIILFSVNVLAGILTMLAGSLIAWVGSFILYGFGELIDNTQETKQDVDAVLISMSNMRQEIAVINAKIDKKKASASVGSRENKDDQLVYCPKCGRANIPSMTYCSSCGSKL